MGVRRPSEVMRSLVVPTPVPAVSLVKTSEMASAWVSLVKVMRASPGLLTPVLLVWRTLTVYWPSGLDNMAWLYSASDNQAVDVPLPLILNWVPTASPLKPLTVKRVSEVSKSVFVPVMPLPVSLDKTRVGSVIWV